jgi:hypothetical protein
MNYRKQDYLYFPIIPLVGAGGIKIGDRERNVLDKLGDAAFIRPGRVPKEEVRFLHYTGLMVYVWNGTVKEIHTRQGYLGTTAEGLGIGASWTTLRSIYPAITFSEEFGNWYVPGINGMSIEIFRPPRLEESATAGPERLDHRWINELYEVMDPEHAFVGTIAVHS